MSKRISLSSVLYNTFIRLFSAGIHIASFFNPKAKLWLNGRKNWQQQLSAAIHASDKVIWMHCSSLGEFEQGRPLLERLKKAHPDYKILLTFFSPSGYEVRKNYSGADLVMYLPLDSNTNAEKFLELAHPKMALFVKYEFWNNLLVTLKTKNIPTFLVSGIFRPEQLFFKKHGRFFRNMLHCFNYFFVQNEASKELLTSIDLGERTMVSGDTRFDRVKEITDNFEHIPLIQAFCKNRKVLVAGSTWLSDDELLSKYALNNPALVFIIAPHETDDDRIREVMNLYSNAVRFSELQKDHSLLKKQVLVIDHIGMLAKLYAYADIAYVGGAFDKEGVHNVLEPAAYYKPVVFGPIYDKYSEAVELIQQEGAICVRDLEEMKIVFDRLLSDHHFYSKTAKAAGEYVNNNTGATEKILRFFEENQYLTQR